MIAMWNAPYISIRRSNCAEETLIPRFARVRNSIYKIRESRTNRKHVGRREFLFLWQNLNAEIGGTPREHVGFAIPLRFANNPARLTNTSQLFAFLNSHNSLSSTGSRNDIVAVRVFRASVSHLLHRLFSPIFSEIYRVCAEGRESSLEYRLLEYRIVNFPH